MSDGYLPTLPLTIAETQRLQAALACARKAIAHCGGACKGYWLNPPEGRPREVYDLDTNDGINLRIGGKVYQLGVEVHCDRVTVVAVLQDIKSFSVVGSMVWDA